MVVVVMMIVSGYDHCNISTRYVFGSASLVQLCWCGGDDGDDWVNKRPLPLNSTQQRAAKCVWLII